MSDTSPSPAIPDEMGRWVSDAGYAVAICRANVTCDTICHTQHALSSGPDAVLAGGITATLLLGTRLKGPGMLSLSHSGDGAFQHFRCDAIGLGSVRGMVLPTIHDELALWDGSAPLIGAGKLQVTHQIADAPQPYQTVIEVDDGSVGHMVNRYLRESAQVSAAIAIDVRQTDSGLIAQGLYLERLPGAPDDHPLNGRLAAIGEHPSELALADDDRAVLAQLDADTEFRELHRYSVGFHCPCSRERYISTLRGFSQEQVTDLSNESGMIETICDFCRSRYDIDVAEVLEGKD